MVPVAQFDRTLPGWTMPLPFHPGVSVVYIGIDVRTLLASLGSIVCACAVLAQPAVSEKRTVSGVVVDSATGASIPQARVVLRTSTPQPRSVMTDGAGRFSFGEVADSNLQLTVLKQGYQSDSTGPWASVSLSPGSSWQDLTIKLTPLCAIRGRVVTADEYPIQGLEVQALRVRILSGRRQVSVQARQYTNDLGEYRLWHLPPAAYYVRVGGQGSTSLLAITPPGVSRSGETYGPLYYPASPDQAAAELLRLSPGLEARVDFALAPRKAFEIRGTISNLPSFSRGSIRLFRGEEEVGYRAALDVARGAFQVTEVPPGSYVLQAATNEPDAPGVGEAPVTVDNRDVTGVTVTLTHGVEVQGTVRLLPGTSAAQLRSLSVQATLLTPERAPASSRYISGGVQPDGAFALKNVLPGRYAVKVFGGADYYASSIRSGSNDVLADGLSVGFSSPPALAVELGKDAARLDGTVTGLPPEIAASVVLVHRDQPTLDPHVRETDDRGRFSVRGLPPGTYSVYAWCPPYELEYQNPAVLSALSSHAVTVRLSPGASERITLGLVSGESN